jgi:hypothetical protein
VLDVALEADTIWLSALLSGEGELLVSSLAFEEVSKDVAATGPGQHRPLHPLNLDFSEA